jgi:multidrug efflux pump subunit AcrA (membrane-fusion protein)
LKTKPLFAWYIGFLLLVLAAALAWSWFGRMDVVVRANALIRPTGDISTVKNAVGGQVALKTFSKGRRVAKGELLFKIDATPFDVELRNSETRLARVEARRRELALYSGALDAGENIVPKGEAAAFARALVYFSDVERLDLAHTKAQEAWQKEKSLPSSMTLPQKLRDLEFEERRTRIDSEGYEAQARLKLREDLEATEQEFEGLGKRVAELRSLIRDCEVRSPIAGVVEELMKLNSGDHLFVGEELLRIVPEGEGGLNLELRVDARDIAGIREGMRVSLRFPGLPPSKYGTLEGRIDRVPADAGAETGTSLFYSLDASLAKSYLESRAGERVLLKPGMSADARIIVKSERILQLILEKLDFLS